MVFTLRMDLFTLIPRTLIGVAYPGFASLKAVLSDSPDSSVAWMKYWVVLGVFSVVELLLDPVLNPLTYSFPTYLILKCLFLAWCMAPIELNGSDVIFNNVSSSIVNTIFLFVLIIIGQCEVQVLPFGIASGMWWP